MGLKKMGSCCIPQRYVLAILGHLGIFVAYTMRVNLSVGLVAMVNSTYVQETSTQTYDPECQGTSGSNSSSSSNNGEFNWDENTQGIILGSFFYGYLVTQLPGGLLATRFGAKWVFGVGILITSVLTVLTPIAARQSVALFVALRIVEGLGEGVTFPAMHAMLSKWAPVYERSKLATFIYSGIATGTLFALPISGILCDSSFLGGWPAVFYIFGALGILWFITWSLMVSSFPESHSMISKEELDYIISQRGHSAKVKLDIPWKKIFLSMPVWAIIVANLCNNWTFYTFLTSLPLYFSEVLNFPIKKNGFLSALPFLAELLFIITSGQIADRLRHKGILSTGATRKLLSSLGFFAPATLLIVTSYMGCSEIITVVALMTLAVGFLGCNHAAYSVNHIDIASNYAGILQGISNSAGTIPGFVGPQVVGILTENQPTRRQWQKVLFIAAGITIFGGIFYLIFASGREQEWNKSSMPHIQDAAANDDDDEDDYDEYMDVKSKLI